MTERSPGRDGRNLFRTQRRAQLPLALVLVSLTSLVLLPLITFRITGKFRTRISDVAQPARALVTEIQNAITLESAASRAFLITRNDDNPSLHQRASAVRRRALDSLSQLTKELRSDSRAAFLTLSARIASAEPLLDSLFAGTVSRYAYIAQLPSQQARLEAALDAATLMDNALATEVMDMLQDLRMAEAIGATLTIGLVLLALFSAALVANLTRNYVESEGRFRQIAGALNDFVWLSDTRSRPLFVNDAYERIWGRPRAELFENPQSFLDGVHPDDRGRVHKAILNLPLGGFDLEFRIVRPDGQTRWVWSRGFPVRNERGVIYRVAGITEDITERKVAADSRTRLIRGFTHDVKNPLGAADGYLSLFEEGTLGRMSAKQLESIGHIRRSVRSALNLVTQLLDIARAEAGQLVLHCAPMDVMAATRELMEEFRPHAQAKDIALALDAGLSKEALVIESDIARVRQVLANLVSNAVKYTDPNGHVTISVAARENADIAGGKRWVAVTVSDDGPGIPADKQDMLFHEFTRFNPGAAAGSGIGLAISQRVARVLGGSITFKSAPDRGSTFTLWLPSSAPAEPTRATDSMASRDVELR